MKRNGPDRARPEASPDPATISQAAVAWYRQHGRDLPWRRTHDPYAILVSELMLQQTTVAAVIDYYKRFLERFPTPASLAAADEQEVLTLWAGLGYYRRARLLQAAARAIVESHHGQFPQDLTHLQALPGVGRYTAGAIASFAFDQPAPIIEANTARLLARLFGIEGRLSEGPVQRRLWEAAEQLLPAEGGCEHNSALMDLGALICVPGMPRCSECPLAEECVARRQGRQLEIPAPAEKPVKVRRRFAGVVLSCGDRFLVRQIPEGEWHAGMFEFPKWAVDEVAENPAIEAMLNDSLVPFGWSADLVPFAQLRYVVTRHTVTLDVWRGTLSKATAGRRKPVPADTAADPSFRWVTLEQLGQLPLGTAQRRLLSLLVDDLFAKPPAS